MIYIFILSVTLLAFVLYYKKKYKIEFEKNQKLLLRLERTKNKKVNEVDKLEKETQKIMKQTGLTYELAQKIARGDTHIRRD